MKYRLKKPLPFLAAGMVFHKGGTWGGGWGVDLGNAPGTHGAHRGIVTFTPGENEVLTAVMCNTDWSEAIPENITDLFLLLDGLFIDRHEFKQWVTFGKKD